MFLLQVAPYTTRGGLDLSAKVPVSKVSDDNCLPDQHEQQHAWMWMASYTTAEPPSSNIICGQAYHLFSFLTSLFYRAVETRTPPQFFRQKITKQRRCETQVSVSGRFLIGWLDAVLSFSLLWVLGTERTPHLSSPPLFLVFVAFAFLRLRVILTILEELLLGTPSWAPRGPGLVWPRNDDDSRRLGAHLL